jgi:hypothetical protein
MNYIFMCSAIHHDCGKNTLDVHQLHKLPVVLYRHHTLNFYITAQFLCFIKKKFRGNLEGIFCENHLKPGQASGEATGGFGGV